MLGFSKLFFIELEEIRQAPVYEVVKCSVFPSLFSFVPTISPRIR